MQPILLLDLSPDEILKLNAVLCTMFHRSELYRAVSPCKLVCHINTHVISPLFYNFNAKTIAHPVFNVKYKEQDDLTAVLFLMSIMLVAYIPSWKVLLTTSSCCSLESLLKLTAYPETRIVRVGYLPGFSMASINVSRLNTLTFR